MQSTERKEQKRKFATIKKSEKKENNNEKWGKKERKESVTLKTEVIFIAS